MKHCSNGKCESDNPQPLSNFTKNKLNKDGLQYHCRSCRSRVYGEYHHRDPDKTSTRGKRNYWRHKEKILVRDRAYKLKKKYGLTVEQYDKMLSKQKGRCGICSIHAKKLSRRLCVDHDHKTGKVRELLCVNCNSVIGKAGDDPKILKRAVVYLGRHSDA